MSDVARHCCGLLPGRARDTGQMRFKVVDAAPAVKPRNRKYRPKAQVNCLGYFGHFFTSGDVCEITKTPYETLNYWVKSGLIKPSVAPARGQGNIRLWSERDLVLVVATRLLMDGGFGQPLARQVLRALKKDDALVGSGVLRFKGGEMPFTVDVSGLVPPIERIVARIQKNPERPAARARG